MHTKKPARCPASCPNLLVTLKSGYMGSHKTISRTEPHIADREPAQVLEAGTRKKVFVNTVTPVESEAPRAPARGICGEAKRNSAEATRRPKAMPR